MFTEGTEIEIRGPNVNNSMEDSKRLAIESTVGERTAKAEGLLLMLSEYKEARKRQAMPSTRL